jgi:hypothetical protein
VAARAGWRPGQLEAPGRAPYETDCAICAAGIREGMTVNVAVSPHNRHRVTIDVGQATKGGDMRPRPVAGAGTMTQDLPASAVRFATTMNTAGPGQSARSEAERLSMLTQLSQLHRQGDLTDAEFAQQKAQILGE